LFSSSSFLLYFIRRTASLIRKRIGLRQREVHGKRLIIAKMIETRSPLFLSLSLSLSLSVSVSLLFPFLPACALRDCHDAGNRCDSFAFLARTLRRRTLNALFPFLFFPPRNNTFRIEGKTGEAQEKQERPVPEMIFLRSATRRR